MWNRWSRDNQNMLSSAFIEFSHRSISRRNHHVWMTHPSCVCCCLQKPRSLHHFLLVFEAAVGIVSLFYAKYMNTLQLAWMQGRCHWSVYCEVCEVAYCAASAADSYCCFEVLSEHKADQSVSFFKIYLNFFIFKNTYIVDRIFRSLLH